MGLWYYNPTESKFTFAFVLPPTKSYQWAFLLATIASLLYYNNIETKKEEGTTSENRDATASTHAFSGYSRRLPPTTVTSVTPPPFAQTDRVYKEWGFNIFPCISFIGSYQYCSLYSSSSFRVVVCCCVTISSRISQTLPPMKCHQPYKINLTSENGPIKYFIIFVDSEQHNNKNSSDVK